MAVTSTDPNENASPRARPWGLPARSGAARTPRRWACGAMLAATMVVAGACGGEPKPPVVGIAQAGVDSVAGSLRILAMHVVAPAGDGYPSGSDLRVIFTVVNVGTAPDALVGVSSPDAERVEIRWDRDCDGRPEVVPRLPIAPEEAPVSAKPAGVGPFDPYDLLVVAVRHDVPAGTNVPLSLTFGRAGKVSTSAYVQPRSANITEPVRRCVPPASPAQR
jgi:copper(I)-binding protein